MRTRPAVALASLLFAACLALSACSESTRYRVLSFFLDGVPPPGTPPPSRRQYPSGRASGSAPDPTAAPAVTPARLLAHAPYRENRCGGCHDLESGGLVQPLERGLCLSCHPNTPGGATYVHGPVAVQACVVCHHYHASPFPKLLLADPVSTCLQCHERSGLMEGPHHPRDVELLNCTECHDPHGGEDRYFLRRSDG